MKDDGILVTVKEDLSLKYISNRGTIGIGPEVCYIGRTVTLRPAD